MLSPNRKTWSTPGKHMPHCPHCGAFVSPKTGVCNSSRCSKAGEQVTETIEWPPANVQFTNDRSKWGKPVQAKSPQKAQPTETESVADAGDSPASSGGLDWDRILGLGDDLRYVAAHVTKRTGGDFDELFSVGRMAVIEQAQREPDFLTQKDAYITTFAAWRMRDSLRPKWAQANSVPIEDAPGAEMAGGSFESESLRHMSYSAIAESLSDEAWEILEAIQDHETVCHNDGRLNVNALSESLGVPKSTMYRRVDRLRDVLGTAVLG